VIYDERILERLGKLQSIAWSGGVYRHMFANFPPDRENTKGARWNPSEVPAIYTSLSRETAIAEADFQINSQPVRPSAPRKLYCIKVCLSATVDLSDWSTLASFEVQRESFAAAGYGPLQLIGGAAERLGHDGLFVPSARADGVNLVIFPNQAGSNYKFEVVAFEDIPA
jgi:RES domain-containing protein